MPEQVPDGAEMVKDGTVRLFVDGDTIKLRRPKVGEFRKLRERAYEVADAKLNNLRDAVIEAPAQDAPQAERLAHTMESRKANREMKAANEVLDQEWMAEAVDMLGDKALPEARDDWPVWLGSAALATQLFEHWQSVPPARGVG